MRHQVREWAGIAVVAVILTAVLGGAHLVARNAPSSVVPAATPSPSSVTAATPTPTTPTTAPTNAGAPTFSAGPVWYVDRMAFFGASGWIEEVLANAGEDPNRLFHTSDAGAQWTEVTPTRCGGCVVMGVVLATPTTAISVAAERGQGRAVPVQVATTHDGGHTWRRADLSAAVAVGAVYGGFDSTGAYGLLAVENAHDTETLGSAQVWMTNDGGFHWRKVADQAPAGDLDVVSSRLAFMAVHQQESLQRSTDGGVTWQPILQGVLSAPHFSDATHAAVLVGGNDATTSLGPSSLSLARTSDGGVTWQKTEASIADPHLQNYGPGTAPAWASRGSTSALVIIIGDIWVTRDGGLSWTETASGVNAVDALAIDDSGAMFAGYFDETCPGKANCVFSAALLASSDGGHNWHPVVQP